MDVMIDIETLANTSNSAITQIGVAVFDRTNGDIINTLKLNVDAESCIHVGMEMNVDTVSWWMRQSDEARKSIFAKPNKKIYNALEVLSEFIKNNWLEVHGSDLVIDDPANITPEMCYDPENVCLWCHATFDGPNLDNAYRRCGLETPWHYRSVRDIRTLVDLTGYQIPKMSGVAHDALDDCYHQVKYVVDALSKITIK